MSSVSAATWKFIPMTSTMSFTHPITVSASPIGMKIRSGLYERIMRTTCVA